MSDSRPSKHITFAKRKEQYTRDLSELLFLLQGLIEDDNRKTRSTFKAKHNATMKGKLDATTQTQ